VPAVAWVVCGLILSLFLVMGGYLVAGGPTTEPQGSADASRGAHSGPERPAEAPLPTPEGPGSSGSPKGALLNVETESPEAPGPLVLEASGVDGTAGSGSARPDPRDSDTSGPGGNSGSGSSGSGESDNSGSGSSGSAESDNSGRGSSNSGSQGA
jgi:hypothetical protein